MRYRELSTLGTVAMCTEHLPNATTCESKATFSFELIQCVHARCHHARISYSSKAHPAKTRTLQSILPVAMTHLIFPPPPLSSFFTMPLTNPLESPFDVGPIGTSGAHRMLLTKCSWLPSTTLTHLHSCDRSQHRIVLSSDTESKYFPEGWKTRPLIQLSWPARFLTKVPRLSQIFMLLSLLPVARNSPLLLAGGGFL